MRLHYFGSQGNIPVNVYSYGCNEEGCHRCHEVQPLGLDAEVERLLLENLAPDKIALTLAALELIYQERAVLARQW